MSKGKIAGIAFLMVLLGLFTAAVALITTPSILRLDWRDSSHDVSEEPAETTTWDPSQIRSVELGIFVGADIIVRSTSGDAALTVPVSLQHEMKYELLDGVLKIRIGSEFMNPNSWGNRKAIRFEFPDDQLERLTVVNTYGDKEILLSSGQIVISGDSGKTVIEGHSDSLHILNTNGAIEVRGHHTLVNGRTTNGAISFGGKSEKLTLETLNGSVRADLDALPDAGELRIATTTGAVALHLPKILPASIGVFVRSDLGSVKSDIALLEETEVREKKVQIHIQSSVGSVRILQEP